MLIISLLATSVVIPQMASASVLSVLGTRPALAQTISGELSGAVQNSQKMAIVVASNIGPAMLDEDAKPKTDIAITEAALVPAMGPAGNAGDVEEHSDAIGDISVYIVRSGDTLGTIAEMFGITKATILAANQNLSAKGALKVGTEIQILPMSGRKHVIAKGDTIKKIGAKYGIEAGEIGEIYFANDLTPDTVLSVGDTLIIPDPDFTSLPETKAMISKSTKSSGTVSSSKANPIGLLLGRPLPRGIGVRTQSFHGYQGSAVDMGTALGTPVLSVYEGRVAIATSTGYNGGFGKYVVIDHVVNGVSVRTIYAHLSRVDVSPGQTVGMGQTIGLSGNSGNSTGPHLHFEVRGKGVRNPIGDNRNFKN